MALQKKDIVTLGKTVASGSPKTSFSFKGETYSYGDANEALREEFQELAGTYALYRENKNTIFSILEEIITDVLPKRVLEQYGQFAEVKTFKQGDKPIFRQKITEASKRRANQFVTKCGLAGIYEVFKLDGKEYTVETSAFGGAAEIGFEEFLDKRVDFADVLDIIMTGLDECVYLEIERALKAAVVQLTPANVVVRNDFNESEMDRLLRIADSYGNGTIYCTQEFASTMIPSDANGRWSNEMKNEYWNNGYFATYKNHRVIILPNSYEDDTNSVKVIDPAYAWVMPAGIEKPVKVAFEGDTIVDEYTNYDRSREVQVYKKFGVVAMFKNNLCVYKNTSLIREDYKEAQSV